MKDKVGCIVIHRADKLKRCHLQSCWVSVLFQRCPASQSCNCTSLAVRLTNFGGCLPHYKKDTYSSCGPVKHNDTIQVSTQKYPQGTHYNKELLLCTVYCMWITYTIHMYKQVYTAREKLHVSTDANFIVLWAIFVSGGNLVFSLSVHLLFCPILTSENLNWYWGGKPGWSWVSTNHTGNIKAFIKDSILKQICLVFHPNAASFLNKFPKTASKWTVILQQELI